MHPGRALVGASLCVILLAASGCTGVTVIHERTLSLATGNNGFAEVNLIMKQGQVVSWEWTANGGTVFFDVHSHAAGKVTEHVRKVDVPSDSGSFSAPAAGSYSLLWENSGETLVGLHYRMTGNATLDAAHPPVPPA